ncbi:MAG: hypothetical protein KAR19_07480 [Bacteroidales bacterium]|nr:hypothetical protein [Bacteroidales bacterium]
MNYKTVVERLAESKSDEVIFNHGNDNCIVTLTQLAKSSKKEIRLYTGSLAPEICNNDEYVKAIEGFINSGGKLMIMTEHEPDEKSRLYKLIRSYLGRESNEEEVSEITYPKLIPMVPKWVQYKGKPIHFATGDNSIFRIETDPVKRYARVCFNNEEITGKLIEYFDTELKRRTA